MTTPWMIELNPDDPPAPLTDEARAEIATLALRQRRAGGLLMKGIMFVGGQVEDGMKLLPATVRGQIEGAARSALHRSYDLAARSRRPGRLADRISGDRAHKVMAAVSGAIGGIGGLPTALAELPVATTVIFRAVQQVAVAHGEDPLSEQTRLECLRVFGAGGQDTGDDGIDTSFIGARLSLSGAAVQKLIARVAPHFAAVMSQKLASQAVPLLGAAAGAGTNYAFMAYYVEMAHVHFGLRRLTRTHGERTVLDLFHKIAAEGRVPVKAA
jgi:hypothetical protein